MALAEVLAYLDFDQLTLDYVLVTIEIPDDVPTVEAASEEVLAAPKNPHVPVYLVRSVVVPQEFNIVTFPRAPGFVASVKAVEPFHIDEPLLGHRRSR